VEGNGEGAAPGAPTGTAGTGSSRARTTARPQTCAARSPQARACAPCQSPPRPARPACRRRSAPRPRRPPCAAAAAAARPPASPALAQRATRAPRRVRGCAAPRPRPRAGPGRRGWPHTRGSRPASPPAGRPSSGPRAAAAAGSGRRPQRHPQARSARRPALASPAAFTRAGHFRTVACLCPELLTRTCPFPHLSAHRFSTRGYWQAYGCLTKTVLQLGNESNYTVAQSKDVCTTWMSECGVLGSRFCKASYKAT